MYRPITKDTPIERDDWIRKNESGSTVTYKVGNYIPSIDKYEVLPEGENTAASQQVLFVAEKEWLIREGYHIEKPERKNREFNFER